MFTQPCFIRKNTPELREKLRNLGHSLCLCSEFEGACWLSINPKGTYTIHGIGYTSEEEFPEKTKKEFLDEFLHVSEKKGIVDCQISEDLFLALAALRDDSDKNQWFVLDTDWGSVNYPESIIPKGTFIQCLVDKWNVDVLEDGSPNPISSRNIPAHKATVEELVKHFKE